jgi:hypothetical protein
MLSGVRKIVGGLASGINSLTLFLAKRLPEFLFLIYNQKLKCPLPSDWMG